MIILLLQTLLLKNFRDQNLIWTIKRKIGKEGKKKKKNFDSNQIGRRNNERSE